MPIFAEKFKISAWHIYVFIHSDIYLLMESDYSVTFGIIFSTANSFLQLMAKQTSGRYHRCHGDFDAHLFAHKLLSEGFQDPEVTLQND